MPVAALWLFVLAAIVAIVSVAVVWVVLIPAGGGAY